MLLSLLIPSIIKSLVGIREGHNPEVQVLLHWGGDVGACVLLR